MTLLQRKHFEWQKLFWLAWWLDDFKLILDGMVLTHWPLCLNQWMLFYISYGSIYLNISESYIRLKEYNLCPWVLTAHYVRKMNYWFVPWGKKFSKENRNVQRFFIARNHDKLYMINLLHTNVIGKKKKRKKKKQKCSLRILVAYL